KKRASTSLTGNLKTRTLPSSDFAFSHTINILPCLTMPSPKHSRMARSKPLAFNIASFILHPFSTIHRATAMLFVKLTEDMGRAIHTAKDIAENEVVFLCELLIFTPEDTRIIEKT